MVSFLAVNVNKWISLISSFGLNFFIEQSYLKLAFIINAYIYILDILC